MNQASCSWADISLGSSSFDVISSMHSVDKLGCPFLTAEALIYAKKKQRNSFRLTEHVALDVCTVFVCVNVFPVRCASLNWFKFVRPDETGIW